MNPLQKNKIDISSLNEEEKKLLGKYGKLPQRKDLLSNKLKERKYFDSGDYALSKAGKAGKASDAGITNVGSQFPSPESIPHSPHPNTTPFQQGISGSPVKESSLLNEGVPPSQTSAGKALEAAQQS